MSQTVLICGYGSQGRAQALNLRDAGWRVSVLLRDGSASGARVLDDGLVASSNAAASVSTADVVAMLFSDEAQPEYWHTTLAPCLRAGQLIVFAHGLNLHYQHITPPPHVDVVLAAPMCPGDTLRARPAQQRRTIITAVAQDATGRAAERVATYARAIGGVDVELLPSSIAEETETNLFVEQALLIGGLSHLIQATYDTMVDAGYNPRLASRWCLDDLRDCAALFARTGLQGAYQRISATARHGGLTRGPRIINEHVRTTLQHILHEVQSGEYVCERTNDAPAIDAADLTVDPNE